jgi:FAD:protein FMN transferase
VSALRYATKLERSRDGWRGTFHAMASPCEILVDHDRSSVAQALLETASREAWRIERKFSRYRDDSVVHAIHHSRGEPFRVDDETARLLDFADRCYRLSGGLFDITSGVLRRAWKFDGSDRIPTPEQVEACLPFVGWEKVSWEAPVLVLPDGMEIDFGGIGKEYAVDRALSLVCERTDAAVLVNFGGDLHVSAPRRGDFPWRVGIESLSGEGTEREIEIRSGALATSGDARRFLLRDGVRYSHVLDPRTGWPVRDAPRSVTALAGSCTEAGLLTTIALLHGAGAEAFLEGEGVQHWCLR